MDSFSPGGKVRCQVPFRAKPQTQGPPPEKEEQFLSLKFPSLPMILKACTALPLQYSLPRFVCYRASNFDAWKHHKCRRLNGRGTAEKRTGKRGINPQLFGSRLAPVVSRAAGLRCDTP